MARSDRQVLRLGTITMVGLLVVMAAAFNLQRFPGFKGQEFHAELIDASGLRVGSSVQVAGVKVGRVNDLRIKKDRIVVDFEVDDAVLGEETTAAVEVQNLLGEKFLNVASKGTGRMPEGSTIPLERTEVTFDIVGTLGQLTTTTERTQKQTLSKALNTLATTIDAAAPEVEGSFRGISRLSRTIASRDQEIGELLTSSARVTSLLDERKGDLVSIMRSSNLVFAEIRRRKQAIHDLLLNVRQLAEDLEGTVADNREQLKPTLDLIDDVLGHLEQREAKLKELLNNYGPYVNILGNIVGTGPWFDAYVPNITGVFSGEFVPGPREGS
ncbi:MCE family protein [Nocardioides piscis]|nr:MCE family protein [Nocardioides piscis]